MNQQGNSLVYLLIGLLIVVIGSIVYFKVWNIISPQPSPMFCTQEAKQCPDGSYVGRTGPNCEFSACSSNISPTPTCIPRPACLDSTPRCLIAEPAYGWCKQYQRLFLRHYYHKNSVILTSKLDS